MHVASGIGIAPLQALDNVSLSLPLFWGGAESQGMLFSLWLIFLFLKLKSETYFRTL